MRQTLIAVAFAVAAALASLTAAAPARALDSVAGPLKLETVAQGLDMPWSLAFLPDGSLLVTELGGRLLHVKASEVSHLCIANSLHGSGDVIFEIGNLFERFVRRKQLGWHGNSLMIRIILYTYTSRVYTSIICATPFCRN